MDESAALLEAIRSVLSEGIRRNGASIDWVYRGGDFQNAFRAYGRVGQPCPQCGELIQRLVVGQRGTHICPLPDCARLFSVILASDIALPRHLNVIASEAPPPRLCEGQPTRQSRDQDGTQTWTPYE